MANKAIPISQESQTRLLALGLSILDSKVRFSEFETKLTRIDEAYASYLSQYAADKNEAAKAGRDTNAVVYPLIASLVESFSGYLAEVYLSGYPLFPVVSGADKMDVAQKLEAVMDNHAISGRYPRHLAMFGRDCAKYNFGALEVIWDEIPSVEQLQVNDGTTINGETTVSYNTESLNVISRLDPYNTVWDFRVDMADVATKGDYAGKVELLSRKRLKALTNKLSKANEHMNVTTAFVPLSSTDSVSPNYYVNPPQVSNYIDSEAYQNGIIWEDWAQGRDGKDHTAHYNGMFEVATLYARIIPKDMGIKAPRANSPQIWKLIIVNGQTIIQATPIYNARDMLPILIGSPIEDGMNYQTQSLAEGAIPLQKTLTDLFNIRTASAKRAINDRGLYDPSLINSSDINTSTPAAKIPVKKLGMGKKLSDAYLPMPFDASGTANVNQDISQTINMAYMASGQNPTQQGQFHKGNRTKSEFDSTMSFSSMRSRLLTIALEHQVFVPLKEMLKHNLLAHLNDTDMLSRATNEIVSISVKELRENILEFKIADGFTPSSKMASTELIQMAFQLVAQSEQLASQYDVGKLFAHMMSLGGVKELDQYRIKPDPMQQAQQGQPQPPQGAQQ